jgi:serine/threonine-protein kinase RsbW
MNTDDVIRIDLPSDHKYLSVLGIALAEILHKVEGLSQPEQTIYEIQLAVQEVCANIVNHAYANFEGGRIQAIIELAKDPRRVVIELSDTGLSFDFDAASVAPDLDEPHEGGYGLFLIEQVMDKVSYQAQATGNTWTLTRHI